jgi:hypothetical protein
MSREKALGTKSARRLFVGAKGAEPKVRVAPFVKALENKKSSETTL